MNRGDKEHPSQVILLILALKTCFPKHVFCLRGNHEEDFINRVSGSTRATSPIAKTRVSNSDISPRTGFTVSSAQIRPFWKR